MKNSTVQTYSSSSVEVKTIRPPQFDLSNMRKDLVFAMGDFSKEIQAAFNRTTTYWKRNRPVFTRELKTTGKYVSVTVSTDNKVYGYIDQGTKEHSIEIPPIGPEREGNRMGTYGAFKPGSMPGVLKVGAKGQVGKLRIPAGQVSNGVKGYYLSLNTGGEYVIRQSIEARGFSDMIYDQYDDDVLQERLQKVIDRANLYK